MKKLLFKILSEADGAALGKQVGLEKKPTECSVGSAHCG
jgi:hypothetical protein